MTSDIWKEAAAERLFFRLYGHGMITFKNVRTYGNGLGGICIVGPQPVEMDNVESYNNGGVGIAIYPEGAASWMKLHGLPGDTDPHELAELVERLRSLPHQERDAEVDRSGFVAKLATRSANAVGLVANIVTIASQPTLVAQLLSWIPR